MPVTRIGAGFHCDFFYHAGSAPTVGPILNFLELVGNPGNENSESYELQDLKVKPIGNGGNVLQYIDPAWVSLHPLCGQSVGDVVWRFAKN